MRGERIQGGIESDEGKKVRERGVREGWGRCKIVDTEGREETGLFGQGSAWEGGEGKGGREGNRH